MAKILELNERQLQKLIKKYLIKETFYVPLSKDEQIRSEMSLDDKKSLYHYAEIKDMDGLKSKMQEIGHRVVEKIGKENKMYVFDYLKRMVGRMLMISKQP